MKKQEWGKSRKEGGGEKGRKPKRRYWYRRRKQIKDRKKEMNQQAEGRVWGLKRKGHGTLRAKKKPIREDFLEAESFVTALHSAQEGLL